MSKFPRSGTLRYHHALSLVKCKLFDHAEVEFRNAIKLSPNQPTYLHEYARYCERHRVPPDFTTATEYYFKAYKMDPVKCVDAAVDAANLMRRLDTEQSKTSAAQLFAHLMQDVGKNISEVYIGYAKLLFRQEKFEKSRLVLENGIRNNPNSDILKQFYAEVQQSIQQSLNNPNAKIHHKTVIPFFYFLFIFVFIFLFFFFCVVYTCVVFSYMLATQCVLFKLLPGNKNLNVK